MKITIPLRGSDYESSYEYYELFLHEILTLSNNQKLIFLIDDIPFVDKNAISRIEEITFSIIRGNIHDNNEPEFATRLNEKHPFFHTEWTEEYLVIDLKIKKTSNIGDTDIPYFVNDYLMRLSLLINLSYSTNVDFLPGVIYSDSNKFLGSTELIVCSTMLAYEHAVKIKWPTIKNLTLLNTINWFHKFEIHPDYRSRNNAHRAINAFSHLLGDLETKESSDLFWVMLGIESLLAEGAQNITHQIKEKSIIILGKPVEYTKKLSKLYDYRSRLVHGEFDIYPKFFSDYESYDKEYFDYLEFASSILLALIRELIASEKTKFEFELTLK